MNFCATGALDAHSFASMGNNHLVQNNFGASLGGPIAHNKTFFFINYEGSRHAMTETMFDTVPTADEIAGDFSHRGVNIFDPTNFQPNPNFDPTKPAGPSNPQVIRQQFQDNGVNNVIPASRIDRPRRRS